jgi:hypothetical protein
MSRAGGRDAAGQAEGFSDGGTGSRHHVMGRWPRPSQLEGGQWRQKQGFCTAHEGTKAMSCCVGSPGGGGIPVAVGVDEFSAWTGQWCGAEWRQEAGGGAGGETEKRRKTPPTPN